MGSARWPRNLRARLGGAIGESAIFLLSLAALSAFYELGRVIALPPLPMHLWRQSDCLSITTCLYEGEGTFLEPAMHARLADDGTTGRTAGEAPILYWLVAQAWRVTGPSELVYRCISLAFILAGMLALFRTLRRIGLGLPWAWGLALLVLTSPALLYYSVGFLPDAPAFAMALVGFHGAARAWQQRSARWWAFAMLAFAAGAAMKVTAGMGWLALLGTVLTMRALRHPLRPALAHRPWMAWALALLALGLVAAWYIHAEQYNQLHGGRYTFNGVWPLWRMLPHEVERALWFARNILVFQMLDTSAWMLAAGALLLALLAPKRWPWPLLLFNGLLLIGLGLYTVLWFNALDRHDYYFINPLIVPLALMVSAAWVMHRHWPRLMRSRWAIGAFLALVAYNIAYARNSLMMRTNPAGMAREDLWPLYHEEEPLFWSAERWGALEPLLGMRAALDSAGIPKDALIGVPEDNSINAALYLLGRKGLTNYSGLLSDAYHVERFIANGGRYIVLNHRRRLWQEPELLWYLVHPVLARNGTVVYDLAPLARETQEAVLFDAAHGPAAGIVLRMDTVRCAAPGTGYCFTSNHAALSLDSLPLHHPEWPLVEVEVAGDIAWERSGRKGKMLGLFQYDNQGRETITHPALGEGPFTKKLLIDPLDCSARANLVVENFTGRGYRLALHEVRMRKVRRAKPEHGGRAMAPEPASSPAPPPR